MDDTIYIKNVLKDIWTDAVAEENKCEIIKFDDFLITQSHTSCSKFNKTAFASDLAVIKNNSHLEYYTKLGSYKNKFNSVVALIKRVIRKSAKFIIYPMVVQQNSINLHTARCFQHINSYLNTQEDTSQKLSMLEHSTLQNAQNAEINSKQLYTIMLELDLLKEENRKLRNEINRIGGEKQNEDNPDSTNS